MAKVIGFAGHRRETELSARAFVKALKKVLGTLEISGMPAILRNVAKLKWGFYSREEDRMHLQTLGVDVPNFKVFLERRGPGGSRRVVEPDPKSEKIPGSVLNELKADLETSRPRVEKAWLARLIQLQKVSVTVDSAKGRAIVEVYPGTRDSIRRKLDLSSDTDDPKNYAPDNWRVDAQLSALVLGSRLPEEEQVYIYLPDVIWGDQHDGTP